MAAPGKDTPKSVLAWGMYERGLAFEESEALGQAADAYRESVEMDPGHLAPYLRLGMVYNKMEEFSKAESIILKAIHLNRQQGGDQIDLFRTYFTLGDALFNLERYREAAAAYRRAVSAQSEEVVAVGTLGSLGEDFYRRGRYTEAASFFQQALDSERGNVHFLFHLGNSHFQQKQYTKAMDSYREVLHHQSDYPNAHYNIGVCLLHLKRIEEATGAFQDAIRVNPGHAEAHFNLARVYLHYELDPLAVEEYEILKTLNSVLADRLLDMIYP